MTKKSEDTQLLMTYMAAGFVAAFPAMFCAVAAFGVSLIATTWQTSIGVSLLSMSISWYLFFFWLVKIRQRELAEARDMMEELEKTRKEGPC